MIWIQLVALAWASPDDVREEALADRAAWEQVVKARGAESWDAWLAAERALVEDTPIEEVEALYERACALGDASACGAGPRAPSLQLSVVLTPTAIFAMGLGSEVVATCRRGRCSDASKVDWGGFAADLRTGIGSRPLPQHAILVVSTDTPLDVVTAAWTTVVDELGIHGVVLAGGSR